MQRVRPRVLISSGFGMNVDVEKWSQKRSQNGQNSHPCIIWYTRWRTFRSFSARSFSFPSNMLIRSSRQREISAEQLGNLSISFNLTAFKSCFYQFQKGCVQLDNDASPQGGNIFWNCPWGRWWRLCRCVRTCWRGGRAAERDGAERRAVLLPARLLVAWATGLDPANSLFDVG